MNTSDGVYLHTNSKENVVSHNSVSNNQYGFYLIYSPNNNISSNNISRIYGGRGGVYVKAKASPTAPTSGEYEDNITLIAVGTY